MTRLVGAVAALTLALFGVTMAATGAAADDPQSVPTTTSQRVSSTETVPEESTGDLTIPTDSEPGDTVPDDSAVQGDGEAIPPDGLGDDPDLDALADECFGGDLLGCDLLFLRSPVDSAYEEYGDTCGGRQEAGTENWCALGGGDTPDPSGDGEPVPPGELGDDPALDQLAADCYGGDMQACDDLYWESPIDSDYEEYGNTCGGRLPDGDTDCVDLENPVPGTGDVPVDSGDVPDTGDMPDTGDVPVDSGDVPSGDIPAPTLEPTGLGDDPELDALAQDCYDGTMAACDDLYNASESGTPYEEYGDTCAGRQASGTGRYCETSFPGNGTETIPDDSTVEPSTTVFVPVPPTSTGPGPSLPPLPSAPVTTTPGVPVPTTAPGGTPTVPPLPTVGPATVPPPGATTVPGVPTSAPTASTVPGATTVPGVIPAATLEPTGLGTDPILDGLAQSCFDGDMESCDQLWRDAEPGSDYRDYGDTCAGRQEAGTAQWCVVSFPGTPGTPGTTVTTVATGQTVPPLPPTVAPGNTGTVPVNTTSAIPAATLEPTGLGTDPALDALAQACYAGDMASCDSLFDAAPFNSPYQQYGDTCAGRQQPGTFKYCAAAFPLRDQS